MEEISRWFFRNNFGPALMASVQSPILVSEACLRMRDTIPSIRPSHLDRRCCLVDNTVGLITASKGRANQDQAREQKDLSMRRCVAPDSLPDVEDNTRYSGTHLAGSM